MRATILLLIILNLDLFSIDLIYPPNNSKFAIPSDQIILNTYADDIQFMQIRNSNNEIIEIDRLIELEDRTIVKFLNELPSNEDLFVDIKATSGNYKFNFHTIKTLKQFDFKRVSTNKRKIIDDKIFIQKTSAIAKGLPDIEVLYSRDPSPGYFYLAPYLYGSKPDDPVQACIMIIDNDGTPLFYEFLPQWLNGFHITAADFKKYSDTSYVYHKQWVNYHVEINEKMDSIRKLQVPDPQYRSDSHEIYPLPNGNRMMLSYLKIPNFDLTIYNDTMTTSTLLITSVIHEVDPEGNMVFQWNSLDHIDVPEMSDFDFDPLSDYIDYAHMNSIEMDTDSTLILSFRNLEEITKINRNTGEIIWRMGGKANEFEMISEIDGESPYFATQHDARMRGPNTMSVFDNGGGWWRPEDWSRNLVFEIDEEDKKAILKQSIWEKNDSAFAETMGNTFLTESGNWVSGMGSTRPNIYEYNSDGELELTIDFLGVNYRVYKYPEAPKIIKSSMDTLKIDHKGEDNSSEVIGIMNDHTEAIQINYVDIKDEQFELLDQLPITIPAGEIRPFRIKYIPNSVKVERSKITFYWRSEMRGFGCPVYLEGRDLNVSIIDEGNDLVYYDQVSNDLVISYPLDEQAFLYDIMGNKLFIIEKDFSGRRSLNELQPGVYFLRKYNYLLLKFIIE